MNMDPSNRDEVAKWIRKDRISVSQMHAIKRFNNHFHKLSKEDIPSWGSRMWDVLNAFYIQLLPYPVQDAWKICYPIGWRVGHWHRSFLVQHLRRQTAMSILAIIGDRYFPENMGPLIPWPNKNPIGKIGQSADGPCETQTLESKRPAPRKNQSIGTVSGDLMLILRFYHSFWFSVYVSTLCRTNASKTGLSTPRPGRRDSSGAALSLHTEAWETITGYTETLIGTKWRSDLSKAGSDMRFPK